MFIQSITLYQVGMPMKFPFKTAQGLVDYRHIIVICAEDEQGNRGYGESVAFPTPFYTNETFDVSWEKLTKEYAPAVVGQELDSGFEVHLIISRLSDGHVEAPMAVAGLENALLNLAAERNGYNTVSHVMGQPLADTIPMGVVAGDMPLHELLEFVNTQVEHQCRRIKIKINPRDGYEKVAAVRDAYPALALSVDANRSFSPTDVDEVARFDELGLLCMEEPFQVTSIEDYFDLKYNHYWPITTPLCFDETVSTLAELEFGVEHDIIEVMNIKIGRLGGLYPAKQMIDYCRRHNVYYWIGSMVESSISKMLHVQLAALGDSYMPGDLSDSSRYFYDDLTTPALTFNDGIMKVPNGVGLGVSIHQSILMEQAQAIVTIEA